MWKLHSNPHPTETRAHQLKRPWLLMRLLAIVLMVTEGGQLDACGPFFPNMMLSDGDNPLLVAPVASFQTELDRLRLQNPRFRAVLSTNSPPAQTADADVTDLRSALTGLRQSPAEIEATVNGYSAARALVQTFAEEKEKWTWNKFNYATGITNPPPALIAPVTIAGLPPEFSDYWRGAVAWHRGRTNDARAAWLSLLNRPAAERAYKSTWAAFMLGKSFEAADPARAITYYRQVRQLAKDGFRDSLGLAASTIGWEARIELHRQHYEAAIQGYLEQLASGDKSAYVSLRLTANAALNDPQAPLTALARNADCRTVITAYILAGGYELAPIDADNAVTEFTLQLAARAPVIGGKAAAMHTFQSPVLSWLRALESAKVTDVESATRFALTAYQSGNFEMAQRWVDRSGQSPAAQWLQAKLYLRDGRLQPAAALLAKVSRNLTANTPGKTPVAGAAFLETLHVGQMDWFSSISVTNQILGELGALQLTRREYTEALDCLLRGGFWADAAYVADLVLTPVELKRYVDTHWPIPGLTGAGTEPGQSDGKDSAGDALRYLLGRRLLRNGQSVAARTYFPTNMLAAFDTYVSNVALGTNTNTPLSQRADALWTAARVARDQGMELMGTETEPDFGIHGGAYEYGPTAGERFANTNFIHATAEEIQRAREHAPTPDMRFHYRYVAAQLAWEAAKLMPNNSDETAIVLCTAGSWLKIRDPKAADVFYKALVRRCRNTAIGIEADKRRWFPELDEHNQIIPRKPPETAKAPDPA